MPRWFVLRLSICLRNSRVQRSLQRNLMISSGVVGRGESRENLDACYVSTLGNSKKEGGSIFTVRQRPGLLCILNFPIGERRLLLILLRLLLLLRFLLPVRLRLLLCSTRRRIICLPWCWSCLVSILLLALLGRRLYDMPWGRAR
jgi:hypothetical protein